MLVLAAFTRATASLEAAPAWLDVGAALAPFAPDHELAQTYYREFVAQKIASNERLWDRVINGIYLGSHSWAKSMRKWIESKPRSTDHPTKQRTIGRPIYGMLIFTRVIRFWLSTISSDTGFCVLIAVRIIPSARLASVRTCAG
jgi:hypothetical protein